MERTYCEALRNLITSITFRPLRRTDLARLHGWLQLPHVREFWDDGDRTPEQVQAHYFAPDRDVWAYLFHLNDEAAGYIQAYPVHRDSEFSTYRAPHGESWGIDLFIGAEHWLGRGEAVNIIKAFITRLKTEFPEVRRVLIDPETRNGKAHHIYLKAGFHTVATLQVEGKALSLMLLELPA